MLDGVTPMSSKEDSMGFRTFARMSATEYTVTAPAAVTDAKKLPLNETAIM